MVKGGIHPGFCGIWGYREKTAAGSAWAGPRRPKIQFGRAAMTPAAHAEHAHRFFFVGHCVGANGAAANEGAT